MNTMKCYEHEDNFLRLLKERKKQQRAFAESDSSPPFFMYLVVDLTRYIMTKANSDLIIIFILRDGVGFHRLKFNNVDD